MWLEFALERVLSIRNGESKGYKECLLGRRLSGLLLFGPVEVDGGGGGV